MVAYRFYFVMVFGRTSKKKLFWPCIYTKRGHRGQGLEWRLMESREQGKNSERLWFWKEKIYFHYSRYSPWQVVIFLVTGLEFLNIGYAGSLETREGRKVGMEAGAGWVRKACGTSRMGESLLSTQPEPTETAEVEVLFFFFFSKNYFLLLSFQ